FSGYERDQTSDVLLQQKFPQYVFHVQLRYSSMTKSEQVTGNYYNCNEIQSSYYRQNQQSFCARPSQMD
ncbi:hypothetical protein, partial [Escherichia coli]|uniref:hypothetical protein n=1 Tax=Escherichia coli TaxID=562 RepID=UPI002E199D91|nr:hypothetical protein [Escherichia coli]